MAVICPLCEHDIWTDHFTRHLLVHHKVTPERWAKIHASIRYIQSMKYPEKTPCPNFGTFEP